MANGEECQAAIEATLYKTKNKSEEGKPKETKFPKKKKPKMLTEEEAEREFEQEIAGDSSELEDVYVQGAGQEYSDEEGEDQMEEEEEEDQDEEGEEDEGEEEEEGDEEEEMEDQSDEDD